MVLKNSGRWNQPKSYSNQQGGQSNFSKEDGSDYRIRNSIENDKIDSKYGFDRVKDNQERTGFLINMHSTEILDEDKRLISAVDYYFIQEDGSRFKLSYPYRPYFLMKTKKESVQEVSAFLSKKYSGVILSIESIFKEDLDLPNHLIGLKQRYLKLSFSTVADLMKVRQTILSNVKKNKGRHGGSSSADTYYSEMLTKSLVSSVDAAGSAAAALSTTGKKHTDQMENILDIREYDVPYHIRVSIDCGIFVGSWYSVKWGGPGGIQPPTVRPRPDIIDWPDMIVLAYDIETTKLPLKFPDAASDQIMMISYMIDGQGYLITNREIISQDVEDFEYTPKPEFEGFFTIFNEPDESALITRFFDHILEIRPHIFVTYNGDFFDWAFVEARATVHGMDMKRHIGFSKGKDGVYQARPSVHMDCLCWVKRDSYLPVGSQSLKAVAKSKLRYDPVELDPEDMCRLAVEQPQVLSNYSVSDAVATYYLYMKYVHPFIFALCTIIPMEPDEVLRKGSGTLCETLLMVEAFRANIVFPNKEETQLNKLTSDGHVLDQETYVGGHVEALESGVFRADIPCRFRMIPEAFNLLIKDVEKALKHTIEEEEKIPLEVVTNFDEVVADVKLKLAELRDTPCRMENPIIYHLDVGAMYPNIILTNRLQPSAMVDDTVCAACDFNRPGALCKRNMTWMWRGEFMPASRSEFLRIQLQLDTERFPSEIPGLPHRAFSELPREEQAAVEKKRLSDYCRKVYKKTHVTRVEERVTTICQKENSFYVDTVRAFRDRRYEYKGLCKVAKKQVAEALAKGEAGEIKSAKNREILYDSLQLAHKCILNSFYGYVMRKGARWHSMEMAGIVCYAGANIITKAREIIEQVGRPLELDTDGIWCVLPASFPENYIIKTTKSGKEKVTISYPNAILNCMVKEQFTNHVYHELVDKGNLKYEVRSENSIFFEVDGPYLAMVLPASKEEGKRLKKRYAVFNFDGSLAELKGFEVKRRGELQLIKIFQSSVFDAFLKGDTLEKCYESVAKVANYWLDVLYSKACNMPDSELFELISENRSMSRKLSDYGAQKSTSISTAKRLAEFLGDQMIKDAGLACKYIISRKPEGSPVTERAIPLAIFQAEEGVMKHYLRKWLKDSSLNNVDIRQLLDWDYYITRLGGAIQKIITIPAAMQGLSNPVPRVRHPDWLHKKMLEKTDVLKQRKISEIFTKREPSIMDAEFPENSEEGCVDIEDAVGPSGKGGGRPLVNSNKRKRRSGPESPPQLAKTWREALGSPPPFGTTKEERLTWLAFHKRKWAWQKEAKAAAAADRLRDDDNHMDIMGGQMVKSRRTDGVVAKPKLVASTLGGFLKKAQHALLSTPWQIIQISETNASGVYRVWALVGSELHQVRLIVPRIFYVNSRLPKEESPEALYRKCNRTLPRSVPSIHLFEYTVPEEVYREHSHDLISDLSTPDVEGIYETQVPPLFRTLVRLGCVCSVERSEARRLAHGLPENNTFMLHHLAFKTTTSHPYLKDVCKEAGLLKTIYLYEHKAVSGSRGFLALFLSPIKKAVVVVTDTVRTNQIPSMSSLYTAERNSKLARGKEESMLPPADIVFDVRVEVEQKQAYKAIQVALQSYRDEKKGPTILAVQSSTDYEHLALGVPLVSEFPMVPLYVQDVEPIYLTLDWQRIGARLIVKHYLNSVVALELQKQQCRYFHVPLGNIPRDPALFGTDLSYARHLLKNNYVLWCSETDRPDLGGREADDNMLLTEFEESSTVVNNNPGCYSTVCIELDIDSLAVNTLLQSHRVNDIDGTADSIAFDSNLPAPTFEEVVTGQVPLLTPFNESSACSGAFKILRQMVAAWLRDVSLHRSEFADFQIIHFYRWLRSTNTLLYEPALRRMLYNLMKKLFLQLVAEFKRLGSTIIYANFNKIIICTKKRTVQDAVGYTEFVVTSIRNKELFHGVQITYNQCWQYLVWLDPSNHGGVKGKLPEGLGGAGEGAENTVNIEYEDIGVSLVNDGKDEGPEIVMNWNLCEYLPEKGGGGGRVQSMFTSVVAGYIGSVFEFLNQSEPVESTPRRLNRLPPGAATPSSSTQTLPTGVGAHENTEEFAKALITGDLSQKLFAMTQKIANKLPGESTPDSGVFPNLPGANLRTKNAALEFVKSVCKVLSLDPSVEEEVARLRRNMLRLIGVGEFSDTAEWSPPSVSMILPEVICRACNHCRDIDLVTDNHRAEEDGIFFWTCPICSTGYDNTEIETLLLDIVNRKSMAYILQDLQCVRCLEVKMENMTEHCTCAGAFDALVGRQEIAKCLTSLKSIAQHYGMPILQHTVQWILDKNPTIEQSAEK